MLVITSLKSFQTHSLGAMLDLRTLLSALLDPTTSRTIIKDAQEARTLYFRLRISYVFLQCYVNVNLILSKVHRFAGYGFKVITSLLQSQT